MSERNSKLGKAVEHAAKDHRADRQRSLGGAADKPRQPILRHTLFAKHVPGMNKDRSVEFFCRTPNRLKRSIIEVQRIDASRVRIRVHMRADLCAAQSQLADTSFQFACCKIRILHWNRRQPSESLRVFTNNLRNVVI